MANRVYPQKKSKESKEKEENKKIRYKMKRDCPDEGTMACFVENRLPEGERRELEAHLEECDLCREIVWITEKIWAKEKNGEGLDVPKNLIERVKGLVERIKRS